MTLHNTTPWLLCALAVVGLAGCDWKSYDRPVWGYEDHDGACDDRIDNDRDGLIDCDDPDCLSSSNVCGQIIPLVPRPGPENTLRQCRDRIDNDDNGQFDCGDRKCQAILETCCLTETTDATCSDGLDNDGNGFTDCGDFSCRRGIFVTVCVENDAARCKDGKDNDGDRKIDCDDSSCLSVLDSNNELVCKPRTPSSPENSLKACSDGVDNDNNNYIDCADFGCSRTDKGASPEAVAYCEALPPPPAEDTLDKCTNGKDDDGNGFIDCADFSCSKSTVDEIRKHCAEAGEATFAKCTDGIDNDHNGHTDCADYSCNPCPYPYDSLSCDTESIAISRACVESLSANSREANERCDDGIDNDKDGFIDCEDWDCSHNPKVTVCNGPKVCESAL